MKIAPVYAQPVVHVVDASRVVGVMSALLDEPRKAKLDADNRKDQERLRKLHEEKQKQPLLPYRKALENRLQVDWHQEDAPPPPFVGTRTVEPDLATLREYIDWTFFFTAWELKGSYPQILDHPQMGETARELFQVGQEVLDRIVDGAAARGARRLRLLPGPSRGRRHRDSRAATSSIASGSRATAARVSPTSRSPISWRRSDSGVRDHVGAFAVSAGFGADELAKAYEAEHDDYRAIVAKALADRLAEAFAEYLHEQVRREWYAPDEQLSSEELIKERYRGTRPAFGYPACPDHSEKRTLVRAA